MNFNDLEQLSLKALVSPEDFISDDFIAIYNFIYQHCTQKSDVFIVRGVEVYESLKKVLRSYSESLRPITSLKMFSNLSLKLQHSLRILSSAYSYLERYYIKSAINIRDGHTQDITTLVYNTFYSHYLNKYYSKIQDYILYEISFQRKKDPKYDLIRTTTHQLNTILLYNDLEKDHEDFMNKYYKGFYRLIRGEDISKVVKMTNQEIKNSQNFFEKIDLQRLTYCVSKRFKEVIDLFIKEYEEGRCEEVSGDVGVSIGVGCEVLKESDSKLGREENVRVGREVNYSTTINNLNDYKNIEKRLKRIKITKFFSDLIQNMKDEHISLFLSTLNYLIGQELQSINTVEEICLYSINTTVMLRSISLGTSKIYCTVKNAIEKILVSTVHVDILSQLVEDIRGDTNEILNFMMKSQQYKEITREMILVMVMKIIKISYLHEEVLKKITRNIQQRLLMNEYDLDNNGSDDQTVNNQKGTHYNQTVHALNDQTFHALNKQTVHAHKPNNYDAEFYSFSESESSINKDKMIIGAIEKTFGISYISWLKIAIDRFLQPFTQSFGLSNQTEDLKTEVRLLTKGFWDIPVTPLGLHPTLKGIETILIKKNLLLYPKSEISTVYQVSPVVFTLNNVEIRASTDLLSLLLYFQECDCLEEVKIKAQDENFNQNVKKLLDSRLLIEQEGLYKVNYEYKCVYNDDLSIKPVLSLFSVEFKTTKSPIQSPTSHIESAIEAFCIRKCKKSKSIPETELCNEAQRVYKCTEKQINEILKKLESKEYVKIEDGIVYYLV